jgi:putative membrane protein
MSVQRPQALVTASIVLVALLALSGAWPYDRTTWMLEVFPVIIV